MEVEYELTREDLYAFQWRASYLAPSARRERLKAYGYLFLIFLFIFFILPTISGDGFTFSFSIAAVLVTFLLPSITFVLVVFFASALLRWQLRRAILERVEEEKPGQGQVGRHKIRLTEAEIVEQTEVGESRTSWAGVDRIEQNDDYFFIYTSPHGAHVVPKRAFGSPDEAASFYQLAKINKEAATLKERPTVAKHLASR